MDRAVLAGEAVEPDILHREDQHRGQPRGQAVEQKVHHRPRGTAACCVAVTIQNVLAHVEIEGRQFHGAEVEQLLEHPLEVVGGVAVTHHLVEFGQTVQHIPLQLGHIRRVNPVRFLKMRQRTQQEPHRIAQATVAVGDALEDLRPDAQVGGVIRLRHPEAQDVRAVLLGHVLGRHGVAQRFGHLVALLVEREAVGQHAAIGRTALRAAGLQHRRMEPAPVLVGALEIKICQPVFGPVRAVAQHESVGRA